MAQALELVCALLLLGSAQALIPIQCANDVNLDAGKCCPVFWGDGSPCGKDSGRGSCRTIGRRLTDRSDFRAGWPTYFFQRLCVCWGNYGGADCGECRYGWRGAQCQQENVVVRRDIANMSPEEQATFIRVLDLSKRTLSNRYVIYASERASPRSRKSFRRVSVYDTAAYLHYLCSKIVKGTWNSDYAHRGPHFYTWHRMWGIHLEQEIRNITGDDSFSIPFWSWVGKTGCDVCTDDLFGRTQGGGSIMQGSIFSTWRTYCTNSTEYAASMDVVCAPGPGQTIYRLNGVGLEFGPPLFKGLPTQQDYDACLRFSVFDNPPYNENSTSCFRNALEGFIDPQNPNERSISMHIAIHVFCSGTLLLASESANDPLFPSIHVHIDKILDQWWRLHTHSSYPTGNVPIGHRADDNLAGFIPTVRSRDLFGATRPLGYSYEGNE